MPTKRLVSKKQIAAFLALIVLVTFILSALFVSVESGHKCHGEDCPICECMQICENILHVSDNGASVPAVALLPIILIFLSIIPFAFDSEVGTLITQKVRMNN